MAFTVTPGTTYSATSQVTSANLNAHVSGLTISGVTNTQVDTAAASLVQIISGDAGATTTEGAPLWNKTTDKFGVSDGTTWVNHLQGEAMATLPRTLTNYFWFDTTLGIMRVYIARNGLTGFHPVENGYLLVNNASGTALAAGDVVVTDYATGVNHVKATTVKKDQTVIGVCLEAIANGASGIIATYGCPKNITVNIDETDGALAVGDGIVSYSATNRGRTAGALPVGAYTAATTRSSGVFLGCFAVALSTVTANAATARMLPQIGTGLYVQKGRSAALLTQTADETWENIDFTTVASSAKHLPLMAAELHLDVLVDAGAAGDNFDVTLYLSANRSTASPHRQYQWEGQGGAAGEFRTSVDVTVPLVDNTTTPTGLGALIAMQNDTAGLTVSIVARGGGYWC